MFDGRAENSAISGGPTPASLAQGWFSSAPTGAQVSPSQATPARGSHVIAPA